MKIGITGADGFLGWHLRALLRVRGGHETTLATRDTFADEKRLVAFVSNLDAVVHLAGMNRGDDASVESANKAIAISLVAALQKAESAPRMIFANSTHAVRDTAYGRGKRAAAATLRAWADRVAAPFADMTLPHVFGEFCRPFYNSVVATFCYRLAHGESLELIKDEALELVHAQTVAERCMSLIEESYNGPIRVEGIQMTVSQLLNKLTHMDRDYSQGVIPDVGNAFDLRLFNTLRSYRYPARYPVALTLRSDDRGTLFEAVKCRSGGQTFLSTTRPGITRGNHFHTRKVERFLVADGEAEIRLRKLFSDDVVTFTVSGDRPRYVDIPTFHAHSITNTGAGELMTLFWTNEIFNPLDPDTYAEPVSAP